MKKCPFEAIPAYLNQRKFPEEQLRGAYVTHIWTQDLEISTHIAKATNIPNIVKNFSDMAEEVDAVLLARDDAELHRYFARPFLKTGIPVYIDKPPALSILELDKLFALAVNEGQIFSCSALRFSDDLRLTREESESLGPIRKIIGVTPKSWDRYAIHVIDPIVSFLQPGEIKETKAYLDKESVKLSVLWNSGCIGLIEATGKPVGEIMMTYFGVNKSIQKTFNDSFTAFRNALETFLKGVRRGHSETSYHHLKNLVQLIELGRNI